MIKNSLRVLRIPIDQRGKITSGIKAKSERSGKEFPKAVDYFDVSAFSEIAQAYKTDKPKKLMISFPTNNIQDFYDDSFVLYGKETKIRQCDGEECVNRLTGEIKKCFCKDLPEKEQCKYSLYLKAQILKPNGEFVSNSFYMFHSGSQNSGNNILFAIQNALNNGHDLREIAFGLEVNMVHGKEDQKKTFPVWSCTALVSNESSRRLEIHNMKQIEAPKNDKVDEENPLGLE